MRVTCSLIAGLMMTLTVGCGSSLLGTYTADVRLMEGREESDRPGYSLAEVRETVGQDKRKLMLMPGGRFRLESANSWVEGDWHMDGNKIITVDDTGNGKPIVPGLRVTRKFTMGEQGELIHGTRYNYYNLEEFYTKQ